MLLIKIFVNNLKADSYQFTGANFKYFNVSVFQTSTNCDVTVELPNGNVRHGKALQLFLNLN